MGRWWPRVPTAGSSSRPSPNHRASLSWRSELPADSASADDAGNGRFDGPTPVIPVGALGGIPRERPSAAEVVAGPPLLFRRRLGGPCSGAAVAGVVEDHRGDQGAEQVVDDLGAIL